ncbi:MAG: hypothetical protein C9356_15020 [Oleiphilus sp.]|nr:MAG: hypothetical protein C9356_15020 [Oleiphilus sp.]
MTSHSLMQGLGALKRSGVLTTVNGNLQVDENNLYDKKVATSFNDGVSVSHYRDEEWVVGFDAGRPEGFTEVGSTLPEAISALKKRLEEGLRQLAALEEQYAPVRIKDDIVDAWMIAANGEECEITITVPWNIQQAGSHVTLEYLNATLEKKQRDGGYSDFGFTQPF